MWCVYIYIYTRWNTTHSRRRLSQTCLGMSECLLGRHGSAVICHGDRSSGCSRCARNRVWLKYSWRRLPLAPLWSNWAEHPQTREQLYQKSSLAIVKVPGPTANFQPGYPAKGLRTFRETDSRRAQQNLVLPRPRRKEQWPHKRLSQTCLWVYGSLQQSCGSTVACCRVGGIDYNSPGSHGMLPLSTFEGGRLYHHYPTIVWPLNKLQGGNTAPSAENWIKELLSMALPTRAEQDPVLPTASPFFQEASTSLLSSSIRGEDRMKTTIIKNKPNWSHGSWHHLTQWNYEPCCGHPRQMGYGEEFWQNVVHWRREWQTTSAFLPWESHKQYEKAKIYDSER